MSIKEYLNDCLNETGGSSILIGPSGSGRAEIFIPMLIEEVKGIPGIKIINYVPDIYLDTSVDFENQRILPFSKVDEDGGVEEIIEILKEDNVIHQEKTIMVFDQAWLFLKKKKLFPALIEKIRNGRKYNTCALISTQDVSDLFPISNLIDEGIFTAMFFTYNPLLSLSKGNSPLINYLTDEDYMRIGELDKESEYYNLTFNGGRSCRYPQAN